RDDPRTPRNTYPLSPNPYFLLAEANKSITDRKFDRALELLGAACDRDEECTANCSGGMCAQAWYSRGIAHLGRYGKDETEHDSACEKVFPKAIRIITEKCAQDLHVALMEVVRGKNIDCTKEKLAQEYNHHISIYNGMAAQIRNVMGDPNADFDKRQAG
ncbi:unnamed protein product, partial [Amoebophrya sp. A120]